MPFPLIRQVRASVVCGGGADYHDQQGAHWIDDHIATPMSPYPEYRQSCRSFGINVLGTLVVNAISGVDLALWDLLGKLRGEAVYQLLGGAVRDEVVFYATGARPLSPDDYWGYAELKRNVPPGMLVTAGEHEAANGRLKLPDLPGFGVELNRSIALHRPYDR